MTQAWHNRSQYGVIIKSLIKKQYATYNRSKDAHIKIKLAHNISNLIQTQNNLIGSRFNDIQHDLDFASMLELAVDSEKNTKKLTDKIRREKPINKALENQYKTREKKLIIENMMHSRKNKAVV